MTEELAILLKMRDALKMLVSTGRGNKFKEYLENIEQEIELEMSNQDAK